MVKDISDIVWWFITGALALTSGLLISFIRYILNDKDEEAKEQTKQLKEMNDKLTAIAEKVVILPDIQQSVKEHTLQIFNLDKRVGILEARNEPPKN